MLLVGLTGGIGSGKSTVAAMLAERGAVVVDADDLARRAVEEGTPGFDQVVDAFGNTVLREDGSLDREGLARVVFRDPDARRRLEAIIHPEVGRLFQAERQRHEHTDRVVVYSVPLLVENGLQGMFDVVVVVTADEAVRLARLEARGMAAEAARDRMAAQLPEAERERVAGVVIRNGGSLEDLERRVDELWEDLKRRAATSR
jgi:dephospho-CoA kinase